MAFVMSQTFIKRQLKSPSTAEFPYMTDEEVSVERSKTSLGKCSFIVRTYVDAQNAFGATVREKFVVELSPADDDGHEWSLENIKTR